MLPDSWKALQLLHAVSGLHGLTVTNAEHSSGCARLIISHQMQSALLKLSDSLKILYVLGFMVRVKPLTLNPKPRNIL